jgi:hypothetical protein
MLADELNALPRLAEAEGFELDHDGDDEVVIGVEGLHVLDAHSSLRQRLCGGDLVAAAGRVGEIVAAEVIGAFGIADRDDAVMQPLLLRPLAAGHDQARGAVRRHHAVQEPDRVGDHT